MKLGPSHSCGESRLSCVECSAQICPQCLVQCPVGNRCRTCTAKFTTHLDAVPTPILLRTAGAALVLGFAFGHILPFIGFMGFWSWLVLYLVGAFIGKLMHKVAAHKLAQKILVAIAGGMIVGALASPARAELIGMLYMQPGSQPGPRPVQAGASKENKRGVKSRSASDPRLAAAALQARSQWPDFVGAFRNKAKGQNFAVKVPFVDGDDVEHMWVEVEEINGDTIKGTLANDPALVHNYKSGQTVEVSAKNLDDWIFSNGRQQIGGFSTKILSGYEDAEDYEDYNTYAKMAHYASPFTCFSAWASLLAFTLGVVSPIMAVRIRK